MIESLKRLGLILKIGSQTAVSLTVASMLMIEEIMKALYWHGYYYLSDETFVFYAGLTCLVLIEAIARFTVWIVAGYFESNGKTNVEELHTMRNYYTCCSLRKKLRNIFFS